MRNFLLFIALCAISATMTAQTDDLLHNPNITWIGENTADFQFNSSAGPDAPNKAALIQFHNPDIINGFCEGTHTDFSKWLNGRMIADMYAGRYDCFKDASLAQLLQQDAVMSLLSVTDTVFIFDPQTYTESVKFVRREMDADNIKKWRARILYFFNDATKSFGSRLVALAPVSGNIPLFWIKIPSNPESQTNPAAAGSISLAIETQMGANTPAVDDIQVTKGTTGIRAVIQEAIKNRSQQILSADRFEPISYDALEEAFSGQDTAVIVDLVNKTEVFHIIQKHGAGQFDAVRFVHHWYYDEKSRVFNCRLTGVAPAAKAGKKPMYYLVCK